MLRPSPEDEAVILAQLREKTGREGPPWFDPDILDAVANLMVAEVKSNSKPEASPGGPDA